MRLTYAALPALLLAACATPGERNDTGACPPGEVCSPETPSGLTFDGARFGDLLFDGGLHATAVGGHQRVSINDPSTLSAFRRDFTASTDVTAFEVIAQSTGFVDVAARLAGHDRLRIADPQTGELFDRVGLDAAAVAEVAISTVSLEDVGLRAPVALWAQTERRVVIALRDAGDVRLVDEGLAIEASTGARNTSNWDSIDLAPQPVGSVAIDVVLSSGARHTLALPITDAIDAIVPLATESDALHSGDLVCFAPRVGSLDVLAAPLVFAIGGPATLGDGGGLWKNCAYIASAAPGAGPVTITASLGAVHASVTLPVAPAGRRVTAGARMPGPTPGERAAE